MLSYDEARAKVVSGVSLVGDERVSLDRALGRVLSADMRARAPVPAASASAMDGYAVASGSFAGQGPWAMPVIGESRTGGAAPPLVAASACRIFTGASLPEGSDSVIMQEDAEREDDRVVFRERPRTGQHVRRAGEDLDRGGLALALGTRLGPFHLALLASLDYPEITVRRRPRVAILCTGDELRAPGDAPRAGSLTECNSVGLAGLVRQAGGIPVVLPLVRDDEGRTEAAITGALTSCDVLVTVGGVSVGDHDVVRPALQRAGVALGFWKVAIKPGKPLALGAFGSVRILALPGNPASAFVTFLLFGMPLLRALQGDPAPFAVTSRLPLGAPVVRRPGRLEFMRARIVTAGGACAIEPLPNQASGAVTSMAWSNALAIVPADASELDQGAPVEVLRFGDA